MERLLCDLQGLFIQPDSDDNDYDDMQGVYSQPNDDCDGNNHQQWGLGKISKKLLMKRYFAFSYKIHVWQQNHVKTMARRANILHILRKIYTYNILLKAGAERKVSFDWGPDGSKAEDCFFGIVALDQVVKYFLKNIK